MDIAIVTGAETPLGLHVIQSLIDKGCRVHGIGNNLSKVQYTDRNFIAHAVDVSDLNDLRACAEKIIQDEGALDILIHALDVTPGAAFENLPVGNLEAVLKIGLLGPVMLTRMALPNLIRFRGHQINIIPANKSGSVQSAVNALIEGGLRAMNSALFNQARDAGLKITNLVLKQNSELPSGNISDEQLAQSRIDLDQVAHTIDYLLNANESNVPNEITLHPRLSPSAKAALPTSPLPVDPYDAIVLPPAEYCPPEEPKIPTKEPDPIERTIPYTDEEMEEKIAAAIEDYEQQSEKSEPTPVRQKEGEGSNKRRRGRRRGGRNRNRHHKDGDSSKDEKPQKNANKPASESSGNQKPTSDSSAKKQRRRGKKTQTEVSKDTESKSRLQKESNKPVEPKPEKATKETKAKPAKKKATKKAAKKTATKKVTVKAEPVKKAAKKVATKKVVKKKSAKKATKKAAKKKATKKAD